MTKKTKTVKAAKATKAAKAVKTTEAPKKKRVKKTLAEIKLAQQAFYRKNRTRLLAYANNYYAEHKEAVLVKAKERYAKKRKDYFCTECGKKLPREISGHHLYCAKCRKIKGVREQKPAVKTTKPTKKAK